MEDLYFNGQFIRDDGFYIMFEYLRDYSWDLAISFSLRKQTMCCHPIKSYRDQGMKRGDKKKFFTGLKKQSFPMFNKYFVEGSEVYFEAIKTNSYGDPCGRLGIKLNAHFNDTFYADFADEYYFDSSLVFSGQQRIVKFNRGFRNFDI